MGPARAMLALAALSLPSVFAQATLADAASVAIYYDGPDQPLAEGFLDAHQIQNLLGHFGLSGEIIVASASTGVEMSTKGNAGCMIDSTGSLRTDGFRVISAKSLVVRCRSPGDVGL